MFIDGAASINRTYSRQDDTLLHVSKKTLILVLACYRRRRTSRKATILSMHSTQSVTGSVDVTYQSASRSASQAIGRRHR